MKKHIDKEKTHIDILVDLFRQRVLTGDEVIEIAEHCDGDVIKEAMESILPGYFRGTDFSKLSEEQKARFNQLLHAYVGKRANERRENEGPKIRTCESARGYIKLRTDELMDEQMEDINNNIQELADKRDERKAEVEELRRRLEDAEYELKAADRKYQESVASKRKDLKESYKLADNRAREQQV